MLANVHTSCDVARLRKHVCKYFMPRVRCMLLSSGVPQRYLFTQRLMFFNPRVIIFFKAMRPTLFMPWFYLWFAYGPKAYGPVFCLQNLIKYFWDTLILMILFWIKSRNNFCGEVRNISDHTKSMLQTSEIVTGVPFRIYTGLRRD